MKTEELRTGNYAYYNGQLNKIDLTDFRDILENSYEINYYQPIPLTEELLLKCGFDTTTNKNEYFIPYSGRWHFVKLEKELLIDEETLKESFVFRYRYFLSGCMLQVELLYLHQLQNIFFALTNQELKIIL